MTLCADHSAHFGQERHFGKEHLDKGTHFVCVTFSPYEDIVCCEWEYTCQLQVVENKGDIITVEDEKGARFDISADTVIAVDM